MTESAGELTGKVCLVTGAGSGIGRASAELLAKQGGTVALLGRTRSQLDEVAEGIRACGRQARVLVADVSREDEVRGAIEDLIREQGRLDVVFANAGVNGVWAPIERLEPDAWRETLGINLNGTFFTIKYSAPYLKKQGGSVIVCASVNGTRMFSNTGATAYACSKAGQVALAKMLAIELGRERVRVNVICPGAIDTEIDDNTERKADKGLEQPADYPEGTIPLTGKKSGTAQQVAELVLFLASDRSSHVNGTEVYIDGGQSLVEG
ncbi:MAG TPA: SDR family NAD(P)-dependent oxidoreductase [Polyangiaceae bacterium]|nr:SDR family NAD(P)-dependent oxidoreductase [Polyangiaceae bacterium]